MIDDADDPVDREPGGQGTISSAAARALAEAEARRRDRAAQAEPAKELGRSGPDPTRYGDWEKGGIVSDF